MSDTIQSTTALASLLESRLTEWDRARKPQEQKMLDCYMDVMRIPREGDTRGSGAAKTGKTAGLFIGSTRNKVRAARAKINDALFGNGLMPFDTTPTDESLAKFADTVEDIVTEQLERMDARHLLKNGVDTLATYGTGFIFGPFVRKECLVETTADNSAGIAAIKESKYEYDFPYFELGNSLDVYPDTEARKVKDGLGTFWVTMESAHTVAAWKSDKSYKNIDEALKGASDAGNETGGERSTQMRGNVEYWHKAGRIKVARFFGKVPRSALHEGQPESDQADTGEMVNIVAIMAGGVVVKANESPYGERSPVLACPYEEVAHEIWGVGVAENNAPHQKVTNAAFRLFMEGKAMALLGTKSVDRSCFMPTENFKKSPGKVYDMKPNLSPDQRKNAIIEHVEADITNGWMDVLRVSEQMSDDDTGITKYTQGDDSRNLNKTATGISMIMSAASLPTKEVIQNIDANWIEPIVEALIEWNLKYLEPETVEKIHGKEAASIWAQIKAFGKSSFMDWQATGTSSFMQKEVLTNKLRAFADFALSNPMTAQKVDVTELLQQTWDVMQIGKESPILKDDGEAKIPEQVKQKMQQTEQHAQEMEKALQELGEKFNELHAGAEDKRESRLLDRYKAETERLKLIYPTMPVQIAQVIAQEFGLELIAEQREENANEASGNEPAEGESAMQPPTEAPNEQAEPQPETEEPPGMPEPPQEMRPEQPADAGFFTPNEPAEPGQPA